MTPEQPNQHDYVTVVSGLPRSGTSMMMKMLEAGGLPPLIDRIRTADEDNPKGYYEFERVKKLTKGDVDWIPEARGKAVKIITALLTHLPADHDYRVVFMRRALPEILASQRKLLERRDVDPDKVSNEKLTQLYTQHLRQVRHWMKKQPRLSVLDVSYNDLVRSSQGPIQEINRFLGGTLNWQEMTRIIDPGLYRQRG